MSKENIQIRLTVTPEIDKILTKLSSKLGKKKSTLSRELMEGKLFELMNTMQGVLKDE